MFLKCLVYTDMVCLDLNSSQNWIYNYNGKMPAIGKKLMLWHLHYSIGTASANSVEFSRIRPRMYIEDLL